MRNNIILLGIVSFINDVSILVFAGFERAGKGLRRAPRDTIIADSMPDERGKGFGINKTLDTLGAILGKSSVGIPTLLYVIFNITYAVCSIPFGIPILRSQKATDKREYLFVAIDDFSSDLFAAT